MSDTQELALLLEFYRDLPRQGPGSERDTLKALSFIDHNPAIQLNLADIGCGTGAQTLTLARALNAHITAVDLLDGFLHQLRARAEELGWKDRISTLQHNMEALPFEPENLDIIWSEGAIYIMGFARGVQAWSRFLKPGGYLAVSEITWLGNQRPQEIEAYWTQQYPEIDTASAKMSVLEANGLVPVGYFPLPVDAWTEHYYQHVDHAIAPFLLRHPNNPQALAVAEEQRKEMELYERFKACYSYGFYVARKA